MMSLKSTESVKVNKIVIWLLVLIFMLAVWPGQLIREECSSQSFADDDQRTDMITEEMPVVQEFYPQYDRLHSVSFILNRKEDTEPEGMVYFRVFDEEITLLAEQTFDAKEIADGKYTEVILDLPVREGKLYYFRIEVDALADGALTLSYRSREGCGPQENERLFYGGTVPEDASAVTRYEYRKPLGVLQVLTYDSLAVLCGMLLMWLNTACKEKWQRLFTAALGLLPLVFFAWFLLLKNIFGVGAADRLVYGAGLLTAGLLWCGMAAFHGTALYAGCRRLCKREYLPGHLRTLLFAGICLLGMYYFNSGSNHGHRMALRVELICFALVFLSFDTVSEIKRELLQKRYLIWTALCAAGTAALTVMDIIKDGAVINAGAFGEAVLGFLVAVLWGCLIIRFFTFAFPKLAPEDFREKAEQRAISFRNYLDGLDKSYLTLLLVFFVLLVAFGRGKGWTFFVAIPFTMFYLKGLSREQWHSLFWEFCNGALVSFGLILMFSLLFRPYHKFFAPRYPLAFYSVATCSLYLTVVFIAAFLRLADGFLRRKGLQAQFGNCIIMGVVFCYTVMAVSRTAFLALFAAGVAVFFCLLFSAFRHKGRRLAAVYITACGAGLLLFPAVFTATRSLPAIVGHPFIMGGELWEETITSTDRMDSEKYMDIERFQDITTDKIFQLFTEAQEADGEPLLTRAPYRSGFTASLPLLQPAALVAHGITPEEWYNESSGDATNGRLAIFAAYLQRLNMTGHESMGVDTETMSYAHAHNTFLQTAYDHGIPTGLYFLVLGAVSFVRSILYGIRRGASDGVIAALPAAVVTAFGVAGLTEWVFHPSILPGFALLLVQGPLIEKLPVKKLPAQDRND